MRRLVIACLVPGLLAGCGAVGLGKDRAVKAERVLFEGIRFRADATGTSEDRRDFTVSVRAASQNIMAAQQAGEFEAVKYCLGVFGGSDLVWNEDPFEDPETVDLGADDTLTLTGRCTKR